MKKNEVKVLSARDHILLRPGMYAGSISPIKEDMLVLHENKFVYKEIEHIPAFMKIINEILDNSIDEAIRTNFKFANKIYIDISHDTVSIEDNGRGVPQEIEETTGKPQVVVAFTQDKAGGNFTDEKANGIGMNGVGSFITNVFSKSFIVETCNGKELLKLVCENNAETENWTTKKCSKKGTKVTFQPDLERFGLDVIPMITVDILSQRLYHLSMCFPEIKFELSHKLGDSMVESIEF